MKKEKAWKDRISTNYWFKKGNAKYERTYLYGRKKICLHTFEIEKPNERYYLEYSDSYDPEFYTKTYSETKKEWMKSKKIHCKVSELPPNIQFILRVTQGTLGSYR